MWIIIINIFISIIIIKTSSSDPSGKNKIVYKLLMQPHKHLLHGNTENKLMEATNDWLLPETHLTFRCQTQCREGHSTHGERQETPYKLRRPTYWYFRL